MADPSWVKRFFAVSAVLAAFACWAPLAFAASSHTPAIVQLAASPTKLPALGGRVQLRLHVRNGVSCTFTGQSNVTRPLAHATTVDCSSGIVTLTMHAGPNTSGTAGQLAFFVRVTGPTGAGVQRMVSVAQPATAASAASAQVSSASTTTTPTTTTTTTTSSAGLAISTSVPAAWLGVPYAANLLTTGGSGAGVWSVNGGTLPPGLTLSDTGRLFGTPTASGTSAFSLKVTDGTHGQATATFSFVVGPAPTNGQSTNWSGYAETGGPFTDVSGTFTVPQTTATTGDSAVGEWVGIDGWGDSSLIQAGVGQQYDSSTKKITDYAWWEILPALATPVSLPVAPGNTMTVRIDQVTTTNWAILITNDSTGQSFTTTQAYSGPTTSAEWIVEAPESGSHIVTLAPYSPNVAFTNLAATGAATALTELSIVQSGSVVSSTSTLADSAFNVAYGSTAPAAPTSLGG